MHDPRPAVGPWRRRLLLEPAPAGRDTPAGAAAAADQALSRPRDPLGPTVQRIVVSGAHIPPRESWLLTIQDAEYLIAQLQRAIKRAPRAR